MSQQCPSCSSADLRRVEADTFRCNRCDALLAQEGAGLVVRVPGDPTRQKGSGAAVVALAVLVLAVVAGVVVGTMSKDGDGSDRVAKVDRTAAPKAQLPKPGDGARRPPASTLPDIELTQTRRGTRPDGTAFWLLTYRNLERVAIAEPAVIATLFASGKGVGEHVGEAIFDQLRPNEDLPVLVVAEGAPNFEKAEVLARVPSLTGGDPPRRVQLGTGGVEVVEAGGAQKVRGWVKNILDRRVTVEQVVAVGRGDRGAPVAWAEGQVEETTLRPGDEVEFEAVIGDYVIEKPQRWSIIGAGRVIE